MDSVRIKKAESPSWYDYINPFTDNKEAIYQRGQFIRGVGKGILNAPGDLAGLAAGVAGGIGTLASGEGFGKGFDSGFDLPSKPWHRLTRWASTPVREAYDKAHNDLLEDIAREQGQNYANYVKDLGWGVQQELGNPVGGILGYGAIANGVGAIANASGLTSAAAARTAPVIAAVNKVPVAGKPLAWIAQHPGSAIRRGAAGIGTYEGARDAYEFHRDNPESPWWEAAVKGLGTGLTTYAAPAVLSGSGFIPQMVAGDAIQKSHDYYREWQAARAEQEELARSKEIKSRFDSLDDQAREARRLKWETLRPGPVRSEYRDEHMKKYENALDTYNKARKAFKADYGLDYVPPVAEDT